MLGLIIGRALRGDGSVAPSPAGFTPLDVSPMPLGTNATHDPIGIPKSLRARRNSLGAILLYHDITENLAKKYPEHRRGRFYECSTSKLTKHVCSIDVPLMDPKILLDKVINKLKTMGYKYKDKISDTVHVVERPYRYIRKYGKPCSIVISLEDKLKFYYELPPSVSAGTIDLEWIETEVREIIKEIYGSNIFSENKQFNSPSTEYD